MMTINMIMMYMIIQTIYRENPIQSPINIDTRRTITNPNTISGATNSTNSSCAPVCICPYTTVKELQ